MWRRARLLMLWLLCAALPVQGAAATAMALCGPGGHQPVSVATTHDASTIHDHATAGHASHDVGEVRRAIDADVPEHGSAHTCSACASCCIGAGPVTYPGSFDFGQPPDSFAHPVGSNRAVYLTGGLERPPRPFLA